MQVMITISSTLAAILFLLLFLLEKGHSNWLRRAIVTATPWWRSVCLRGDFVPMAAQGHKCCDIEEKRILHEQKAREAKKLREIYAVV